ncbi:protein disulfide-isomerase A5-like [Lingula anatina]|uniref:Protein disulfide-isomerase A5-like n=1 Tax=Lingula anatina TaxID=7574 RepID=A0A1S3HT50_LINAN|nr:protein disulfide-isomerase A5-like [Lingula anatina]|eukprot:XP_013389215.1 protein disulfide-isomerase A5-like [Lingula anatina]
MEWMHTLVFLLALILCQIPSSLLAKKKGGDLIIDVDDVKEFKKLLKTRTNVLVAFGKTEKALSSKKSLLSEVALEMKGKATVITVDCSEAKKLCKKFKISPSPVELKHYKDGEFNKDYDRKEVVKSMVSFLQDPTGDLPWVEDSSAEDVTHLENPGALNKLLSKEKKPILVMFYAPWCGFCKRLKPDYAAAATELKGHSVLVGMDVDKPEMMPVRQEYNITGFPTIVYFENGKKKYNYGGQNNKEGIISWMKNPEPPKEPEKEAEWADEETEVVHLQDSNFDEYVKDHPSVLVMFYAPWCGHCKKMKPEYVQAAAQLKEEGVEGILAAVDATKERKAAETLKVQGFPTVKYFKDGEYAFDFNERTADKLVEFMKDPKEPPPPPPPEAEWSEQEDIHVNFLTEETFKPFMKKKKHTLVMFYAPWCGHCKKAKPHYTNAAEIYKDDPKIAYAAVDCTKYQSLCTANDVSGYPTFKYYNYGKNPQQYQGGREEADFVNFMKDPNNPEGSTPPPPPQQTPEEQWADVAGAENLNHLTSGTFEAFVKENPSVLVMFYAPWCGHCKAMKPAYGEAAQKLKEQNINGVLAAVDATQERDLTNKYKVTGFPTLKYFRNGEVAFEYNRGRSTSDLVSFMTNPEEKKPEPPKPEAQWSDTPSNIRHLTQATFTPSISDMEQVLVMFYAPWCGHCKRAKPEFEEAANSLQGSTTQFLAAVDCTAASELCSKEGVTGYPTFRYYSRGEFVKKYQGGRSKQDFTDFLNSEKSTASDASKQEQQKQEPPKKEEKKPDPQEGDKKQEPPKKEAPKQEKKPKKEEL